MKSLKVECSRVSDKMALEVKPEQYIALDRLSLKNYSKRLIISVIDDDESE